MYKYVNDKLIFEYIEELQTTACCIGMLTFGNVYYHNKNKHISDDVLTCTCGNDIVFYPKTTFSIHCSMCGRIFFMPNFNLVTYDTHV